MDSQTPDPADLPQDRTQAVVPDPHAGEPAPPTPEGARPEADMEAVRPEADEPGGPLAGLLGATATQVADEATPGDDGATEALLAQMGVEEEGIESGQLLGFVVATLAAVAVLSVVIIYLIYTPFREDTQLVADASADYDELQQSRVDALAKLTGSTRTDETYTVPITRAMGLVAAQYGSQATGEAYAEAAASLPTTRAAWNTLMVNRTMGRAVQQAVPVAPLAVPAPAIASPTGADPVPGVVDAPPAGTEPPPDN